MAKTAQLSQFDEELYKVTGDQADKYLIAVCFPVPNWTCIGKPLDATLTAPDLRATHQRISQRRMDPAQRAPIEVSFYHPTSSYTVLTTSDTLGTPHASARKLER